MARTDNFTNFATDVADSIRSMTGETGLIPASEFDTEIKSIKTAEDLTEELTTYDNKLTEQETSIQTIIEVLSTKGTPSGDSEEIYSTEEVKTGRTWLDGKPIYRKVFTGNFPTITHDYNTYTNTTFDTTGLQIDTPVSIDGTIDQNNGYSYWALNFYHSIVGASAQTYFGSENVLVVRTNCSWLSTAGIIVILEYTKTTD